MADLITSARAKQNINLSSYTTAEDTHIASLVSAVSASIRRHCRREFDSQSFDELVIAKDDRRLIVKQYPILSVSRVATGLETVLKVRNTSASNQRATVAVTSTGLSLVRVASGVSTTSTVAWASYATLSAVATQVNAIGSGWEAEAITGHTLRASSDLRAVQGALNAKDVWGELKLHTEELSTYAVDTERGWIVASGGDEWAWSAYGMEMPSWCRGQEYRVMYTAGYAAVPEDVQEAAAEWVSALFWLSKKDPGIVLGDIPRSVCRLLGPYRKVAL